MKGLTRRAGAEPTVAEKILLAALHLEELDQSPFFSAEALIVAAWQKYPRTFGLKGREDLYPDANRVLVGIMGERGLTRHGLLSKPARKVYALTHEGRRLARRLTARQRTPSRSPASGGRRKSEEESLVRLAVQFAEAGLAVAVFEGILSVANDEDLAELERLVRVERERRAGRRRQS